LRRASCGLHGADALATSASSYTPVAIPDDSPAMTDERGHTVATIVFALPILPGKEDVDREMLERLNATGLEKDAYVSARRAQGITREQVWHQVTPNGTLAIIVLEGDDLMSALGVSATSDDPFHRQFREFVKDVHGVDLANDPPPDLHLISDTRF
jgi:hypothetical protein